MITRWGVKAFALAGTAGWAYLGVHVSGPAAAVCFVLGAVSALNWFLVDAEDLG